jgi:hypothetical protein
MQKVKRDQLWDFAALASSTCCPIAGILFDVFG